MKLRNGKCRLNSRKIFQMVRYMRRGSNHSRELVETSSLDTFQFSLDKVARKYPLRNNLAVACTGDYNGMTHQDFCVSFFFSGLIAILSPNYTFNVQPWAGDFLKLFLDLPWNSLFCFCFCFIFIICNTTRGKKKKTIILVVICLFHLLNKHWFNSRLSIKTELQNT